MGSVTRPVPTASLRGKAVPGGNLVLGWLPGRRVGGLPRTPLSRSLGKLGKRAGLSSRAALRSAVGREGLRWGFLGGEGGAQKITERSGSPAGWSEGGGGRGGGATWSWGSNAAPPGGTWLV